MWFPTSSLRVWIVGFLSPNMNLRNHMDSSCSPSRIQSRYIRETLAALTNIRSFNQNVDSVHHMLSSSSWVTLFLTEIQIASSLDTNHRQVLITNLLNASSLKPVSVPISIDLLPPFDIHIVTSLAGTFNFCGIVYCANSVNDPLLLDLLSSNIKTLILTDHGCQIIIPGEFSDHNKDWMLHPSDNSTMGREVESFVIISQPLPLIWKNVSTRYHVIITEKLI